MEARLQVSLQDSVQRLETGFAEIKTQQTSTAFAVAEIRGWLVGSVDPAGQPTPGVLQILAEFTKARKRDQSVLALIAAGACTTAVAAVTNAIITALGQPPIPSFLRGHP